MATITVRVRTSKRMCRVNVPASGNIGNVKAALASDVGVDPAAMTISLDPAGQQVPQDHDTFGRLGIQHGTIVFMETSAAIAPSSTPTRRAAGGASLSASGRFVVQNGRVVPAAQAAQSAARSGAGGGAGAGAGSGSGPASAAVNLGRTAKDLARVGLPSKPATDTTGEAMEWLCTHPPHQMCTNCAPLRKGEKVKLDMLCQHGPDSKCLNCLPSASKVDKRKHLAYEEFLENRRARCEHSFNATCANCLPPSEVSYKLKPNCTKHKPWPHGLCSDCQPPPASLNRQKYRHVDYVEILHFQEMARFVSLWTGSGMTIQRACMLIGHFEDDPNYPRGKKAVVEAIYEPPQINDGNVVSLLEDPKEAQVDRILAALGLCRVGWCFTHPPRDYFVSSGDVRKMARLQLKYRGPSAHGGSMFSTLIVAQNAKKEIEPRAFMASDQGMALERDRVLGDSKDPEMVAVRKPDPKRRECLPRVLRNDKKLGAKEVTSFEVEFLLVEVNTGRPVGSASTSPMFLHSEFPIENRTNYGEPQSAELFRKFLLKNRSEPYHKRLSDFHALVYLGELFDMETALSICECVRDGTPLPEGATLILDSLSGV